MTDADYWHQRRGEGPPDRPFDARRPFERDKARVIHSAAFRRLQSKTQVLGVGEGDFHRTRLTHSMEVAQIGTGLVRQLEESGEVPEGLLDAQLIETVCLAHDLGHPPFGHGGEIALNYMMRDAGGFEGNGQTLRLLARLEAHTLGYGLDLTRRTLLGILKYPAPFSHLRRHSDPHPAPLSQVRDSDWKPPKCYLDTETEIVDWLLEGLPETDRREFPSLRFEPGETDHGNTAEKALDTTVMDLADDIAYGVHDLEDAIALGLVERDRLEAEVGSILTGPWAGEQGLGSLLGALFPDGADPEEASSARKRAVGSLVHAFISSVRIVDQDFQEPLLRHRAELGSDARELLDLLRGFVAETVIQAPAVQAFEYRGQQVVMRLFEALASDPERLLKRAFARRWRQADSKEAGMRVVCDFVAGMTDEYANRMYERLFMPRTGTVFERL